MVVGGEEMSYFLFSKHGHLSIIQIKMISKNINQTIIKSFLY